MYIAGFLAHSVPSMIDWKYSSHVYYNYATILTSSLLLFSVFYVVIDLMFSRIQTPKCLLLVFIFSLTIIIYNFYDYFNDPLYLYKTEDIKQWANLNHAVSGVNNPITPKGLSNLVTLQSWDHGMATGYLNPEENLRRIEWLMPYLEGDNWMVLLWRPLYTKVINIDIIIISFILLFFAHQYKKDPPQGAYMDKIMFLILLLSSTDIIHNWGIINSIEWGSLTPIYSIGQYLKVLIIFMMLLFFSLRLRFITLVRQEYYETELLLDKFQINKWRDNVDNLLLMQFLSFSFLKKIFLKPNN
jgi:hypothetical protein